VLREFYEEQAELLRIRLADLTDWLSPITSSQMRMLAALSCRAELSTAPLAMRSSRHSRKISLKSFAVDGIVEVGVAVF
jgi:hypothetical protein